MDKSDEAVVCFTVGEEERSLVLFWLESGGGWVQNTCSSDDSPDFRVKALNKSEER